MSNVLVLSGYRRSASRAPALACLPELFTQRRHDPGDVRWLKENAEFLRLMVATGQVLDPDILAQSYGPIARKLPMRLSFFPQYYRFFLAMAQDLAALGLPGLDADMLTHQAMARGVAGGELSDLQRAEARLLASRAGLTTGFDPLLSERLLQFAGHSATFALPNRKAAYELTHIAFYLTDYGRHELVAGARLRDSLEYVGLIAWLDQDVDLLAEVCLALRFCGQSPPDQWEDWVAAMLARFALVPMPDAAGQDDYHAWLMAAWAVAAAGGAPLAITVPVDTFGFVAPPVASVLGEISAALFNLGPRRASEWAQLRWQLSGRLSAAALDLLDQGAAATPRFVAFMAGFSRGLPWDHAA